MIWISLKSSVFRETTCLGVAYLAGVATGFWKDMEEVADKWQCEKRFEPRLTEEERKELMDGWNKAVKHSSGWLKK